MAAQEVDLEAIGIEVRFELARAALEVPVCGPRRSAPSAQWPHSFQN
jgi:hypothetical protein